MPLNEIKNGKLLYIFKEELKTKILIYDTPISNIFKNLPLELSS